MLYDVEATLQIIAHGEGISPEEVLAKSLETKDYTVIGSTINGKAPEYISVAEYAKKHGLSSASHIRALCTSGKFTGAVKIGRNWCVPADAPLVDRRITSGNYIGNGNYQKYVKPRREREKAEREK